MVRFINCYKTLLETPYAFSYKKVKSLLTNKSASFFDFINAIYPPATIWGIPVEETEEILSKTEPFAREYYTGLYGYWTLDDTANIALVIRSANWKTKPLVFMRAEVLGSSNPEAEYDEAENKIRPMLAYFVDEKIALKGVEEHCSNEKTTFDSIPYHMRARTKKGKNA